MKNKIKFILIALLVFSLSTAMAGRPQGDVKYPSVAGKFYPADAAELKSALSGYSSGAAGLQKIKGQVRGILVPHAGYNFSAGTAAYGYSVLDSSYDYIIVIGTSHTSSEYGLQTCLYKSFVLPNGTVKSDPDLLKKLISKNKAIRQVEPAFFTEHSVEVQLPFLIEKVKDFKLLPFVVSNLTPEDAKAAAETIYGELKDKKVLVVVSSDLSHYPDYDTAKKSDKEIINCFMSMETEKIPLKNEELVTRYTQQGLETSACGELAAAAGIEIMKKFGADKAALLKYSSSGDTPDYGDKSRVVGYASIVFTETGVKKVTDDTLNISIENPVKIKMLKYARQAIEQYIKTKSLIKIEDKEKIFDDNYGIFVTLKEAGELRGCIGSIEAVFPLRQGIPELACSAAFSDYRFSPVEEKELKDIDIEISILSPNKRIKSADEIVMGTHGVIVKKGGKTGLFLPQVAKETGWTKEQFLNELCSQKAGLPAGAWKDKDTELYIFTVYNFSESGMK
jgi:MEMO1 family protein